MSSKHEAPMTPIEKIRADVEQERKQHFQVEGYADYCGATHAPGTRWPCKILKCAEDKLKLAEALEDVRQMPYAKLGKVAAQLQCRICHRYPEEPHGPYCWFGAALASIQEALDK